MIEMMKETWVNNNTINIHIIDCNSESQQGLPFVIIPGLSEAAEDYVEIMKSLSPRRCVAISLRGRGKSDAPQTGYTLEHHISDIEVVIKYLGLDKYTMMGFSRGVSYALGYTLENPQSVKGLIIGDYPAYHSQLPPEWVEWFSALSPWRGKLNSERMKPYTLKALQTESIQVLFWNDLRKIKCPVLIIRGGLQGALLSEYDSIRYLKNLSRAKLLVFEESDHDIFNPKKEEFIKATETFLKRVELNQISL